MTDTTNNQTTAQADKPAPEPQSTPKQKANVPVAVTPQPEKTTPPSSPALPDQPTAKPPAQTKIKTTKSAQNADIASAKSKKIPEQVEGDTSTCRLQKELPHQEDDLVPFEIIEHEQEPPEKLKLEDAISILPDDEKSETGVQESAIATTAEPAPATPVSQSIKTSFTVQFRKKLKQLLGKANQKRQDRAQANMDKIIKYARETQKVTNNDVEKLINISDRQALRYLKKLIKQGKLIKFGKKKNTFYKPVNK